MFRIIIRYFSIKNIPIVFIEPRKDIMVLKKPFDGYEEEFKPNPDYDKELLDENKNLSNSNENIYRNDKMLNTE